MNSLLLAMTNEDRETLFSDVTGSTLFVVAQQSSRMLISQLRLPVRGELEAAIDALSALYLLSIGKSGPVNTRNQAIKSAAAIAKLPYDQQPTYFQHQNINAKRVDRIFCLIVGGTPGDLATLQREFRIDAERVAACSREFERTHAVWTSILSPHMRKAGDEIHRIAVSYNKIPRGVEVLVQMLRDRKVLETAARKLDDFYRFPAPVVMRTASCGEETAYFDTRTRDFLICYDLILRFALVHLEHIHP